MPASVSVDNQVMRRPTIRDRHGRRKSRRSAPAGRRRSAVFPAVEPRR